MNHPPTTSLIQLRREEEKEQRRKSILDAAENLIGEQGWEATNFSDIAKKTRLSRSLIYVYFPTREDLFGAICNRGAAVLEDIFTRSMAARTNGLEQVEAIARAYFTFAREYPVYFRLHAERQVREEAGSSSPDTSYSHPAFSLLAEALVRGIADGSIRPGLGDIKTTALTLWSFAHGLLLIATRKETFLREKMEIPSPALVDHGFLLLREMLAARPAETVPPLKKLFS